jgi:hypothetical protein
MGSKIAYLSELESVLCNDEKTDEGILHFFSAFRIGRFLGSFNYELHREKANTGNWNHHTADPCAVMLAIRGLADYWDLEGDGYINLKEDCSFEWKKKPGAKQGYILQKMERTKLGNIMEELLVSPPKPAN